MKRRLVYLAVFVCLSACSAFVDDIYANLRNADGGGDDVVAPPNDGGGCTVTATSDDGGVACVTQLGLGDGDPTAYAVTALGDDIYVLGAGGAVWTCSGACDAMTPFSNGTGAPVAPTLAATDAGVYWASSNNAKAIERATSSGPTVVIQAKNPVNGLAVAGSELAWWDQAGNVAHCTADPCSSEKDVAKDTAGIRSLAVVPTPNPAAAIYWADGIALSAFPLGPVANPDASIVESPASSPSVVLALPAGAVLWTSSGDQFLYEVSAGDDAGAFQVNVDSTTALDVLGPSPAGVVYAGEGRVGSCTPPNFNSSGVTKLPCSNPVWYSLSGGFSPAQGMSQIAATNQAIVVIDTNRHAFRVAR